MSLIWKLMDSLIKLSKDHEMDRKSITRDIRQRFHWIRWFYLRFVWVSFRCFHFVYQPFQSTTWVSMHYWIRLRLQMVPNRHQLLNPDGCISSICNIKDLCSRLKTSSLRSKCKICSSIRNDVFTYVLWMKRPASKVINVICCKCSICSSCPCPSLNCFVSMNWKHRSLYLK